MMLTKKEYMENPRMKSYRILYRVLYEGGYSNIVINQEFRGSELSNRDRGFITELVYGVLEKKYFLEYIIQRFSRRPLSKLSKEVRLILMMGLYQIRFMNSVTDFATVDEAVKLCKKLFPRGGGFVNGVLRNVLRDEGAFEIGDLSGVKLLSVRHNVSQDIAKLLIDQYGMDEATRMLYAMEERPTLFVRVNTLKTTLSELQSKMSEDGVDTVPVSGEPLALSVQGLKRIEENTAYRAGLFTVQDTSSMLAARALGAQKGESVLDLCACPGGKTTFIAERMGNEGYVQAQDISAGKLKLVDKACGRLGITIVKTREWDATVLDETMVGRFDRVLIDAPCSGLGIIRKKPELRYKEMRQMDSLYETQWAILRNAAQYIRKNGILVYSTCTINRKENEEQVRAFLKNPEFELLEEQLLLFREGESDGFYIAKMRKR